MSTWPGCNYWDVNCLLEDFWERALSLIKGEMSVKRVCFSFHPGMSPSLLLVGKLWSWDYEGKAKSLKDISTGYNYKAALITWNWLFNYNLSLSVGFLLQADKCFPADGEQNKLIDYMRIMFSFPDTGCVLVNSHGLRMEGSHLPKWKQRCCY